METRSLTLLSPSETEVLHHELRVHQIELEMQNDELLRSQESLEASRARWFDLYDQAPVGYATVSKNGLILESNLLAATLLGRARGALVGQPISQCIHKDDQDIWYSRRKLLLDTGEAQDFELRMRRMDGTIFWALVHACLTYDQDGEAQFRLASSDISKQKRDEGASLYRQMLEGVRDYAIIALDAEGRVSTWNEGARRIKGYEAFEIIGKSFERFYTEEDRAKGRPAELLRKTELEGSATVEGWCVRKGGSRFWETMTITPYRDENGRLTGFTTILQDHTERKQTASQLSRMTSFYKMQSRVGKIIAHAADEADLFGEIAKASVEFGYFELAWIGVPDNATGKMRVAATEGPARAYVDGLDISMDRDKEAGRGPVNTAFQEKRAVIVNDWDEESSVGPWKSKAQEHGLRSSASFPLIQEGRSRAVLSLYSRNCGCFDKDTVQLLSMITDDTSFALDTIAEKRRRIRAETETEGLLQTLDLHAKQLEALVKSRTAHLAKLSKAIEQSPVSVIITDAAGSIEYVNPIFQKVTGYTEEEVLGKNPRILNSGENPPAIYQEMWASLSGGRPWFGELHNKAKDGHLFWEHASISPILDEKGAISQFVAVKDDITDRKSMEQELRRAGDAADAASRAKSLFLANMSHEIRTPMNAVLGFAQLLELEKGITARQRDYIGNIKIAGDHLLVLINEILDLARIESGRMQLSEELCDVHRVVIELIDLFRPKTDEKDLTLEYVIDPEVPRHVLADTNKIRQILINLMGNAVKFTSSGGISLKLHEEILAGKASERGHRLCFDVADTGSGVAVEDIEGIFQPFEQTAQGAVKGGTGLGLPISRSIARLMGGDIEAYSELGVGSRFRLKIDVKGAETAALDAIPRQRILTLHAAQREYRILVADDHENNRAVIRGLIEAPGFAIREARDGQEALDAFTSWNPDLVLMDVQMPGMDGLEAIRLIKATERGRVAKVIAVSASALDFNRRDAIAAGADGFIAKPVRKNELFETLQRELSLECDHEDHKESPREGEDAVTLSTETVERLRAAAMQASYFEIGEILGALEAEHPRTVARLRSYLENYAYLDIVEALDVQETADE